MCRRWSAFMSIELGGGTCLRTHATYTRGLSFPYTTPPRLNASAQIGQSSSILVRVNINVSSYLASHRRHLLEFRHGRIEPVPGMTAHRVRHHLRLVSAWIVEARSVNGEEVRHGREGQIDGRPAGGAKAARLTFPLSPTMSQCVASPSSFTASLLGKVR